MLKRLVETINTNEMRDIIFILTFSLSIVACQSQSNKSQTNVGGPCEGCEAIYEYGTKELKNIDTLPEFENSEPKLKITGKVFQKDGMTPAESVILYIYHTNRQGIYPKKGDEKGWAKRHGYLRGWIKTDKYGNYTFYTFRPASYPEGSDPEHIHMTVKEPGTNEYYIDDYVFDDDPLLTKDKRNKLKNRAGSGIVKPKLEQGIFTIHRDLILGLNIPDYE